MSPAPPSRDDPASAPAFFGRTLTRRIDYFAFPRVGSHFFRHCTAGLFDLVAVPGPGATTAEVASRGEELDPLALYALSLREEGVPYAPVWFNTSANGQHGMPVRGEAPIVMLIRDPVATIYSLWRVGRARWGWTEERVGEPAGWARAKLARWMEFYAGALGLVEADPARTLLLRFEDLVASPEPLRRVVDIVGVRPKLSPEFVHHVTRFERLTRPGERTFYVAGDNDAWRRDGVFAPIIARLDLPDLGRFGYPPPR